MDRPQQARRDAASGALDIERLYGRYRPMVRRRLARFVRPEIADELAQEVFETAMREGAHLRRDAAVLSWLYRIATRKGLHHVRDDKRRRELLDHHGPPAWMQTVCESPVESRIYLDQVWMALEPDLAEIGLYHFLDGLSHKEIARLVGLSRRSVGNRIATLQTLVRSVAEREAP